MSHMVRVNTQIKNMDNLVSALIKKGFAQNQIKQTSEAHSIRGYYSNDRQKAHVSISKEAARAHADLGWEKMEDGNATFHRDSMDNQYGTEWQNSLMQTYSEVTVEDTAQAMGFSIQSREVTPQGEIQLTLHRY